MIKYAKEKNKEVPDVKDLFKIMGDGTSGAHNILASVIDDPNGAKALYSGAMIKWLKCDEEFFNQNFDEVSAIAETGIYEIGGRKVFAEVLEDAPELIICGAGHVAVSVVKIAKNLDMKITVIEDREEFAELAKDAGADVVICEPFVEALSEIEGGDNVYFLTMTRAHAFDQQCLEQILLKPSAYVGMLGSAKKIESIAANLEAKRISRDSFARVHTPVGLDINAQTPAEIAVSVVAEIIEVKNNLKIPTRSFSHEMLDIIASSDLPMCLLTIIENKGAVPRIPGTKMVVMAGGDCISTIGGGVMEHQAVKKAAELLTCDDFETYTEKIEVVAETENGMMSSGTVDILFERI